MAQNGVSRSLKVTHSGVVGKPTRHFMTPYNSAGFDCKGSDDTASRSRTKVAVVDLQPTFLRKPPQISA